LLAIIKTNCLIFYALQVNITKSPIKITSIKDLFSQFRLSKGSEMKVEDIRVFIPSKDYEMSKQFYQALGFEMERASDDLSIFRNNQSTFFLTRHYNPEIKINLMIQLAVFDIEAVSEKLSSLIEFDIQFQPIKTEPWGRVIYLTGPSGELWHITQFNAVNT